MEQGEKVVNIDDRAGCQCDWYSCGGPHGAADWCRERAVGVWTRQDGKTFALCQECHDNPGENPISANEWVWLKRSVYDRSGTSIEGSICSWVFG